jgi:hypothetical protein
VLYLEQELLNLIERIEEIEKCFRNVGGFSGIPSVEQIYDIQEFQNWIHELKFELQDIVDRTGDTFVNDTLVAVSANFNGWNDRKDFNKIKAKLAVIKKNIRKYYDTDGNKSEVIEMHNKKPKIFISHSSNDKYYVREIVDLLDYFGLNQTHVFCSSLPGYDIPINKNIFDFLLEQFEEFNLHIMFIHSHNYYLSPISLNEMGAAWALKNNYTSFLLPGFGFNEMRGVVNSSNIAIKLDNDEIEVKDKLNQLYDMVIGEFGLIKKPAINWEQKRNSFLQKIIRINQDRASKTSAQDINPSISAEAIKLLELVANDSAGQILKISDLSGIEIQVGQISINEKGNHRDTVLWESVLDELVSIGLLKQVDAKGQVFQITNSGYIFLEKRD